jgi:hypothetical protein
MYVEDHGNTKKVLNRANMSPRHLMNPGPAVQEAGVPFVALNFSAIYIVPYFQPYISGLETNKRNVTVIADLVELNVLIR